jgi:hypothetical protein
MRQSPFESLLAANHDVPDRIRSRSTPVWQAVESTRKGIFSSRSARIVVSPPEVSAAGTLAVCIGRNSEDRGGALLEAGVQANPCRSGAAIFRLDG